MAVALDARLSKQMSAGMQLYVRELVRRLPRSAPDLQFFVLSNAALDTAGANVRVVSLTESQAVNGGLAEQFGLRALFAKTGADLVHCMSVYASRFIGAPHLYTIHDLIHLHFPQYFSWKVPPYYRLVVKPVARSARLVLTDAHATVADLEHHLGICSDKVRVIPLAAGEEFYLDEEARKLRAARARRRFRLEQQYFLYAGNHRRHKNLRVMVQAWAQIDLPVDLVITEEGDDFGFAMPSATKQNARIILTGRVPRDELIDLYAGCSAAVQPSLYEGFGLGILEAMAAGAPAIAADTPALLEVGGDAVLTFMPHDRQSLERQMRSVLADERLQSTLREAGRQQAKKFSWDETARQTAAAYRQALASRTDS